MCNNTVSYNAPMTNESYIMIGYVEIEESCGNTDAYGNTLVCSECKYDPAARDHRANVKADRESYASSGYGDE